MNVTKSFDNIFLNIEAKLTFSQVRPNNFLCVCSFRAHLLVPIQIFLNVCFFKYLSKHKHKDSYADCVSKEIMQKVCVVC